MGPTAARPPPMRWPTAAGTQAVDPVRPELGRAGRAREAGRRARLRLSRPLLQRAALVAMPAGVAAVVRQPGAACPMRKRLPTPPPSGGLSLAPRPAGQAAAAGPICCSPGSSLCEAHGRRRVKVRESLCVGGGVTACREGCPPHPFPPLPALSRFSREEGGRGGKEGGVRGRAWEECVGGGVDGGSACFPGAAHPPAAAPPRPGRAVRPA
eukprot:scaffold326773_cov52-Tisochrysis_lutea.AAC.4